MAGLLYREDMDAVRSRMEAWWTGGSIGRPVMFVYAPRPEPLLTIPHMPEPENWLTDYSTSNFEYRVYLSKVKNNQTLFLGEAVPFVTPDLAPNCLALYLGCRGVEERDTVWCAPCIDSPESARFEYDPGNFYWNFSLRLGQEQLRHGSGKCLIQFPDLIEGLDTLAAMRGSQKLLIDLIERPDWVQESLRAITSLYFHYYDALYEQCRDETGGSFFWVWAPGRMAKFQCDFSAMISPGMFREFMQPVLTEMCARVDHSLYHWDGPGAIPHLNCLLEIPRLEMIQWVPGAAEEFPDHPKWWPLYHRILEAGKKVFVHHCPSLERLLAMKHEFGAQFQNFLVIMHAASPGEGEKLLRASEM